MRDPYPFIEPILGLCLIVSAVGLLALLRASGLKLDWRSAENWPYWVAGTFSVISLVVLPRTRLPYARPIAQLCRNFTLFAAIAIMGAVASYPIAALTHGYHDAALRNIDGYMHFDWLTWYQMVSAHPILQWGGAVAYQSIFLSPALLLGYWALCSENYQAYRFLFAFWLAAILTLLLFSFMPAVGPFSFLWHRPITYMPQSELWQYHLIPLLRAHRQDVIELAHLRGLVSAPSFHAAAAILFISRGAGVPALRWPLIGINAVMLLSTPVEGTHYLVDVLLGIAVAATAIGLEHQLFGRDPFLQRMGGRLAPA